MTRKGHARTLTIATLTCVVLGVWLSGQLLKQHAGDFWGSRPVQTPLLGQLCDSAAALGFNCTDAAHGAYSEIHLPLPYPTRDLTLQIRTVTVPVAFLGLSYFILIGCWVAFIGPSRPYGPRWHRLLLGLAFAGVCFSVFFIVLMATGQAPRCMLCLAVHALNFLLLPLIWKISRPQTRTDELSATPEPVPELTARLTLTSREVVSVTAFALILIAILWQYRAEQLEFRAQYRKLMPYREFVQRLQHNPEFLTHEFYAQPRRELLGDDPTDNRPRLTVFTDLQCRSCYCNWHKIQTEIMPLFDGQLILSLRHFPLCVDCNDQLHDNMHPAACRAAYAAEAVRLQGGPEAVLRMHELLFQNQKKLSDTVYRDSAVRLGLDPERLLRDMDDPRIRQSVTEDIALAKELGVSATPTLFLNGRLIPNVCRTPVFWKTMAAGFRTVPAPGLAATDERPEDARLSTTTIDPFTNLPVDEAAAK